MREPVLLMRKGAAADEARAGAGRARCRCRQVLQAAAWLARAPTASLRRVLAPLCAAFAAPPPSAARSCSAGCGAQLCCFGIPRFNKHLLIVPFVSQDMFVFHGPIQCTDRTPTAYAQALGWKCMYPSLL